MLDLVPGFPNIMQAKVPAHRGGQVKQVKERAGWGSHKGDLGRLVVVSCRQPYQTEDPKARCQPRQRFILHSKQRASPCHHSSCAASTHRVLAPQQTPVLTLPTRGNWSRQCSGCAVPSSQSSSSCSGICLHQHVHSEQWGGKLYHPSNTRTETHSPLHQENTHWSINRSSRLHGPTTFATHREDSLWCHQPTG